jgi:endonuclease-3
VPFRFGVGLRRIRRTLEAGGYADAAMFELAERGHGTLFEQLVACVLSIRTRDEVSLPASLALLARARTPDAIAALSRSELVSLIRPVMYFDQKAETIRGIAERTATEHGGALPCDFDVLTSFRGVGPKCANLALGIACGATRIAVDVHVHRVTNRWGVVAATSPEETMAALERVLPRRYWIEINRLLVPFGKHICTGTLPKCSTCPVLEMCLQVGVRKHR